MIGWLSALIRRYRDRHDPAWKPTGVRPLTEWSYDYARAKAGAARARKRTASGRVIARRRDPKPDKVTPFRKVAGK